MRLHNKSGITFVESMIATAIFMFIVGGLVTTILAGNTSWQAYDSIARTQKEIRKALSMMTRDLRAAENIVITDVSGVKTVSFTQPDVGNTSYTWTAAGSQANQIIRSTSSSSRIIALNISSFAVVNNANDIAINLTSSVPTEHGQTNTFQLNTKVAKR